MPVHGLHRTAPSNSSIITAGFRAFEMKDDFTKDLAKVSLADAIYSALVEALACKQSMLDITRVLVHIWLLT